MPYKVNEQKIVTEGPYTGEIARICDPQLGGVVHMPVSLDVEEAEAFRSIGSPAFSKSSFYLCTDTADEGIYGFPFRDGAQNMRILKALGDCSFLKENRAARCEAIKELINTYPPPPKAPEMTFWGENFREARIAAWFAVMGLTIGGAYAGLKKLFNGKGPKGPGDGGAAAAGGIAAIASAVAIATVKAMLEKPSVVKPQQPEGAEKPAEEAAGEKAAEESAKQVAQVSTFAALLGAAAMMARAAANVAARGGSTAFGFMGLFWNVTKKATCEGNPGMQMCADAGIVPSA